MAMKFLWGGAVGFLMLAFLNRRAVPGAGRQRLWGDATALLVVLVGWGLLLTVTGRFVTSLVLGLGLIRLLAAGNGLKQKLLGEPLVFSDVFLAGHALRWSRLYFGYVPVGVWLGLAVAVLGLTGMGLAEPAMATDERQTAVAGWLVSLAVVAVGLGVLWAGRTRILAACPLTFDAAADAVRYTALGAAVLQTLNHVVNAKTVAAEVSADKAPTRRQSSVTLGHLVLIQAESFAPVSLYLNRPSVTPMLDALAHEGVSGLLELAWRGAYTMRTEFSVLTGLKTTDTASWAFDPYRLAERVPLETLASDLKAAGYDTVAWHPNDGRFFNRNVVMPHLGFDRFDDVRAFADLRRVDGKVTDEALLAKAGRFLAGCTKPTFLFIVTMESHGPWGGKTAEDEVRAYERHLVSLDKGIAKLAAAVRELPNARLALYGDHLPGLKALAHERRTATGWMMWPAVSAAPSRMEPQNLRTFLRKEVLG